jgi:hypothetical protein
MNVKSVKLSQYNKYIYIDRFSASVYNSTWNGCKYNIIDNC